MPWRKILTEAVGLDVIREIVAKHGAAFIIMAAGLYFFYQQNTALQTNVNACNDKVIQVYQAQNERFIQIIEENNQAIQQNSAAIERLTKKIESE